MAEHTRTNSLALGGMIVGIVGLVIVCCGGLLGLSWFGIPMGIVAIVLGFVSLNQIQESGEGGTGMAYAAIGLGLATELAFFLFFFGILALIIGANVAQM